MSIAGTSGKKTRGRQKIEMKKLTKESNIQVTFSKRRSGLFKKASELSTFCGADVALIVISPGGKVFSFGHPSVEAIIQRYLSRASHQTSDTSRYIEAQRDTNVRGLNVKLSHINNELDAGKKHGDELNMLRKETQAQFWWACQVEEMDKPQLEKFRAALDELKNHVTNYGADVTTDPPTHQFFDVAGGSSYAIAHVLDPPPPPTQVFPQPFFRGPMLQAHYLFGANKMGRYGGPSGFF